MFGWIRKALERERDQLGNQDAHRLALFLLMCGVGFPSLGGFVVYHIITESYRSAIFVLLPFLAIPTCVVLVFRTSRRKPVYLVALLLFYVLLFQMLYEGDVSRVIWFMLFPLLVFFFLERNAALMLTGATALTFLIVLARVPLPGLDLYEYSATVWARFLVAYAVITLLAYGYESVRISYRDHLLRQHEDLRSQHARLVKANDEIQRLSVTDPLTGCFNRAHMMPALSQDLAHCRRYGEPLTVIILDLDHFKRINDTHGHQTGDAVLTHVGELLREGIRSADWIARYGGEEFLIVLPKTDITNAAALAERIRIGVEGSPVTTTGTTVDLTASLGVAMLGEQTTPEDLLDVADRCLYEAKRRGRNRVVLEGTAE